MSLLLDALKKAELAKQQQAAQQGGRGEDTTLPIGSSGTRTTDNLQDAPSLEPLMTRDRLPDIDAPLEMIADQLPSGDPTRSSTLDFALTDSTMPSRTGTPARGRPAPPSQASGTSTASRADAASAQGPASITRPWSAEVSEDRDSARRLLSSKGGDFSPRRPFYVALGILVGVAVGAVTYFWWELQPRSNFASLSSGSPRPQTPQQARPPTSAPSSPAIAQAPAAGAAPITPITSGTAAPTTQATPVPAVEAPVARLDPPPSAPTSLDRRADSGTAGAAAPISTPRTADSARVPTPPSGIPQAARSGATERPVRSASAGDPIRAQAPQRDPVPRTSATLSNRTLTQEVAPPIAITRVAPRLDPTVDEAYTAFQRGDIEAAQQLYMRVAQSDPTNRDAQLGLAAVDLRTQNLSSAESRYIRLLEIDPRDSHALAGLSAIRGAGDPVQAESRIKTLLTQQPDSAMLHFVLGNQYASQARWNEAQQAYFRAFSGDPENADFAFNLAVSLDQIRQDRFALEYYERALRLSNGRQVAFDRTRTATRVKELQR